ncbi:hypothetical protein, partial [Amycolatopsis cihanbeyliensis]
HTRCSAPQVAITIRHNPTITPIVCMTSPPSPELGRAGRPRLAHPRPLPVGGTRAKWAPTDT